MTYIGTIKSKLFLIFLTIALASCASGGSSIKNKLNIKVSERFNLSSVTLSLTQKHKAEIQYHTEKELESLLKKKLIELLEDENLLSSDSSNTSLSISTNYKRTHPGEATSIPSDALAYPIMSYDIKLMHDGKLTSVASLENQTFNGGFVMNLQVVAMTLREKSYEVEFIEGLAKSIVDSISNL